MSKVEYGLKNAWNRGEKSFSVYVASPKVDKKTENRVARYKRANTHRVGLSGPTGEKGNEPLPYSKVNSKGDEYPRKKKILYWVRILRWKNNAGVQILMGNVYEEEDKESKRVLLQVAGSYSNRDRKPIPLSEVDRFIWDKMGEKGVSRKKENGRGKMYEI